MKKANEAKITEKEDRDSEEDEDNGKEHGNELSGSTKHRSFR